MLRGRKSNEVININSNNNNNNNKFSVNNNSFDLFTSEFEINDVRISARNILTKVRKRIHNQMVRWQWHPLFILFGDWCCLVTHF